MSVSGPLPTPAPTPHVCFVLFNGLNHDMNHDMNHDDNKPRHEPRHWYLMPGVVKSLNQRILPLLTCILVWERRFPHLFWSWQPGKYLSPGVISPRTAIFGSSSKPITRWESLRQCITTPSERRDFVMVCHGSCHGSVVVLSWFIVVRDVLFSKILQKKVMWPSIQPIRVSNSLSNLIFDETCLFSPFHLKSIPLKSSAKNSAYTTAAQLMQHVAMCMFGSPFRCKMCGESFSSQTTNETTSPECECKISRFSMWLVSQNIQAIRKSVEAQTQ